MCIRDSYYILPHHLLSGCIWFRYVDDIFAAVPNATNPQNILNFINTIHTDIQYTMETATNNTIPFLDTLIITDHNTKPSFTVYRKPTSNPTYICLLYTSDAADERSSVDLGGRRIIKKKKTK